MACNRHLFIRENKIKAFPSSFLNESKTDCLIQSLNLLPQDASNSIVVCYLHSQCKSIKSRTKPAQVLFLGYNSAAKKYLPNSWWLCLDTFFNIYMFEIKQIHFFSQLWGSLGCEAAGPTQAGSSCTRFFCVLLTEWTAGVTAQCAGGPQTRGLQFILFDSMFLCQLQHYQINVKIYRT